jgi:hypothetical protein
MIYAIDDFFRKSGFSRAGSTGNPDQIHESIHYQLGTQSGTAKGRNGKEATPHLGESPLRCTQFENWGEMKMSENKDVGSE